MWLLILLYLPFLLLWLAGFFITRRHKQYRILYIVASVLMVCLNISQLQATREYNFRHMRGGVSTAGWSKTFGYFEYTFIEGATLLVMALLLRAYARSKNKAG